MLGNKLRVPTPEVKVSLPSPTQTQMPTPNYFQQDEANANQNGLLSPPETYQVQVSLQEFVPPPVAVTRTRRSASVGTLPSLDQIREWSLRRHGVASDDQSPVARQQVERPVTPPPGLTRDLSPPVVQIVAATPPQPNYPKERLAQLNLVLQGSARVLRRQQAASMPSSPAKDNFGQQALPLWNEETRVHCAKQMVSALGRRRSLSLVR